MKIRHGLGATDYATRLQAWASDRATELPGWRRVFWTWRRLLTTVEPPGGCRGPLNMVDDAVSACDTIAKNGDSPDGDLYKLALFVFQSLTQLQQFKAAGLASFGQCQWGP